MKTIKHTLSNKQLELFIFFTLNYGCSVTCKEILDAIWCGMGNTNVVRRQIYFLRQKLPIKMVIRNVSKNRYLME